MLGAERFCSQNYLGPIKLAELEAEVVVEEEEEEDTNGTRWQGALVCVQGLHHLGWV